MPGHAAARSVQPARGAYSTSTWDLARRPGCYACRLSMPLHERFALMAASSELPLFCRMSACTCSVSCAVSASLPARRLSSCARRARVTSSSTSALARFSCEMASSPLTADNFSVSSTSLAARSAAFCAEIGSPCSSYLGERERRTCHSPLISFASKADLRDCSSRLSFTSMLISFALASSDESCSSRTPRTSESSCSSEARDSHSRRWLTSFREAKR
mmetsp:Transcript_1299/g.2676  ORF Transcript_1299/g.2676 Transcript_1299/m.2676 type:complete len:218 (+) Transcript_1299:409-1062(+)